jgi:hypothetical protein
MRSSKCGYRSAIASRGKIRGRLTRLALAAAILASLVGLLRAPVFALVPSDLCSGNPCVIGSDVTITASVLLDFGLGTALQFAPGIKVLLQNGAAVQFEAGSISIGAGARFSSDAPGSSLYFSADGSTVDVATTGSPAVFVLRDSVEVGFVSAGDSTTNAKVDVTGETEEGGVFYIQSLGNLTFTGKVVADGTKDGQFNAGTVDLDAGGTLNVDAKLRAKGHGADSGQVLMRGQSVVADGGIDVKPTAGGGGTVDISAEAGDVTLAAKIDAGGKKAADDVGANNCNGGSVDLQATGSISFEKRIKVSGGGAGGCSGGTFTAQAGTDFTQGASAPIQAGTPGFISFGGTVQIQAAGNVTLGKIDVGSDNAGSVIASAGGMLDAAGPVKASSNASGDATDGSISLSGACGLTIPHGASLKAAKSGAAGGQINLSTSGGPMTIAGNVTASSTVTLQYVTGFTPAITGSVTPAPSLVEVPTGTCGS